MTQESTQVKNIITSHLQGSMFGMDIYGQHEIKVFDGDEGVCVIEVNRPNRWDRYGQVIVYHPRLGKWLASLTSSVSCGKPVQAFTVDEIKAQKTRSPMIAKVYGVELDQSIVSWGLI